MSSKQTGAANALLSEVLQTLKRVCNHCSDHDCGNCWSNDICEKIKEYFKGDTAMRKIHEVKIRPEFFRDILSGGKYAAIRLNDRGYAVGDIVVKRVFKDGAYTGESVRVLITHILANTPGFAPLIDNYVCFSFAVLDGTEVSAHE